MLRQRSPYPHHTTAVVPPDDGGCIVGDPNVVESHGDVGGDASLLSRRWSVFSASAAAALAAAVTNDANDVLELPRSDGSLAATGTGSWNTLATRIWNSIDNHTAFVLV